jgi:hypothetical protein
MDDLWTPPERQIPYPYCTEKIKRQAGGLPMWTNKHKIRYYKYVCILNNIGVFAQPDPKPEEETSSDNKRKASALEPEAETSSGNKRKASAL